MMKRKKWTLCLHASKTVRKNLLPLPLFRRLNKKKSRIKRLRKNRWWRSPLSMMMLFSKRRILLLFCWLARNNSPKKRSLSRSQTKNRVLLSPSLKRQRNPLRRKKRVHCLFANLKLHRLRYSPKLSQKRQLQPKLSLLNQRNPKRRIYLRNRKTTVIFSSPKNRHKNPNK